MSPFIQAKNIPPNEAFSFASFAERYTKIETLYCVGQPYPFNLRVTGIESLDFSLIAVSKGSLREVMPGDVLDNSDIGNSDIRAGPTGDTLGLRFSTDQERSWVFTAPGTTKQERGMELCWIASSIASNS